MQTLTVTFLVNSTDYITDLNTVVAKINEFIAEYNAGITGGSLNTTIANLVPYSGAVSNINLNNKKITNAASAVNGSDVPNLSQVNSLITAGGNPEDVAITDLNVGTVADGQLVGRVGSAIVGVTPDAQSEINSTFRASML